MRHLVLLSGALLGLDLLGGLPVPVGGEPNPGLIEVATDSRQWTGIAVSRSGRVFVNYPRWSGTVPISVGELQKDGTVRPYPDAGWNAWKPGEDPRAHFVCVQSVTVDDVNRLWILDPASPLFGGTVEGGPKLIQVDLETDTITRSYPFDSTAAPRRSYLNDVRVDTGTGTAFITDSGLGAIVVLDLKTGEARRRLEGHPSVRAEDTQVVIDGKPFPFPVHSDGIALDAEGGWLYYQALTGRTLYRIPTGALRDPTLDAEALAATVERFAGSGVSDGLLFTPEGVYVSALETGSIRRVLADGNVVEVVRDPRIQWPDSFARDSEGNIWFTTSQIHLGPQPPTPYRILKIPARPR